LFAACFHFSKCKGFLPLWQRYRFEAKSLAG
jgi:hypothetical protein